MLTGNSRNTSRRAPMSSENRSLRLAPLEYTSNMPRNPALLWSGDTRVGTTPASVFYAK